MTKPNQSLPPDKSSKLAEALDINSGKESKDKDKADSKNKKSKAGTNLSSEIVIKLKNVESFLAKKESRPAKKRPNKNKKRRNDDDMSDGDDDGAKSVDFDQNFSGDEGVGSGDENKFNNSEPFGDEDDDGDSEPILSEDDEQDN